MSDRDLPDAIRCIIHVFQPFNERFSTRRAEREMMEPLREKLLFQAGGLVLEVGAGNGLNFPYYLPKRW